MIGYIFAGLLGVSNMILWGIYGDLLAEPFRISKVFRSVAWGIFYSLFLFHADPTLPLGIVALGVICLERITTEIYKALIRQEDQSKYTIPSDLGIGFVGQTVKRVIGIVLLIILIGFVLYIHIPGNKILLAIVIGLLGALGGAAKDAPYEGFHPLKFFRSPVVAVIIGLVLAKLFPETPGTFFILATAGGERMVSECYKKIIKGRMPGKFKTTVNIAWKKKRSWLLPLYAMNIFGIMLLFLL